MVDDYENDKVKSVPSHNLARNVTNFDSTAPWILIIICSYAMSKQVSFAPFHLVFDSGTCMISVSVEYPPEVQAFVDENRAAIRAQEEARLHQ